MKWSGCESRLDENCLLLVGKSNQGGCCCSEHGDNDAEQSNSGEMIKTRTQGRRNLRKIQDFFERESRRKLKPLSTGKLNSFGPENRTIIK